MTIEKCEKMMWDIMWDENDENFSNDEKFHWFELKSHFLIINLIKSYFNQSHSSIIFIYDMFHTLWIIINW